MVSASNLASDEIRTCLLAGPGRGDCEHFVGWHDDTDTWGVPKGWCIVCCWRHDALELRAEVERLHREQEASAALARLYGEAKDRAQAEVERLRAALRIVHGTLTELMAGPFAPASSRGEYALTLSIDTTADALGDTKDACQT